MALFKSLAFKNAILYLFIFLIGLGTMGYFLLDFSSKKIIKTAENQLAHNAQLIEIQLTDYINSLTDHIAYLANSPILEAYITNSSTENYNLFTNNYLSLIKANDDFFQLRYLDAKSGKEIVRVDRKNNLSEIIPPEKLQVKRDRAYFQKGIALPPDHLYFSPINLNREFGKISTPKTPTLRLAKPIYQDGRVKGLIVINTDLTKLFTRLKSTVGKDYNLRIRNDEGYYLMHESPDLTFLFEYENVSDGHEGQSSQSALDDEMIYNRSLNIPGMGYNFNYEVIALKSKILRPFYEWRSKSILFILLIGLIFTLIAFTLVNKQTKTLSRLTNNMKEFPQKREVAELPIKREDEIGQLAKGFKEMAEIINGQIASIEHEKQKAERAEKDKSEFIENISHEIRNPLQSIMGLSKILEQNNPNPNQIDILNSIRLNTSNLHGLVNNILDYQNVLNGKFKPNLSWTKIGDLAREIVTGNQYEASQKSIAIKYKHDSALDHTEAHIDKLRISQILSNLISNAITHTPVDGNVSLVVELMSSESDSDRLAFSVIDDGKGMSKDQLDKITDRYFTNKVENSPRSNFGLGLTIVNELLLQLGSELKVASKEDLGSTFYFELNTEFRNTNTEEDHRWSPLVPDTKVLIVDDDKQVIDLYKHLFAPYGTTFISSYGGISDDQNQKYDLIISDYKIVGETFDEATVKINQLCSADAFVLIVSGNQLKPEILKNINNLAATLQKPIDRDNFFKMIHEGLIMAKYGKPDLQPIMNDYDFQKEKYTKAINLLIEEWSTYTQRLVSYIQDKNIDGFEEVLHKFNTTLRRLQLQKFEAYLEKLKLEMSNQIFEAELEAHKVESIMHVLLSRIKDF